MSGQQLVEALLRLGCPRAAQRDGDSFDYLFEYEATAPFLTWFSENIQANNRLDLKDLHEFEELSGSKEGVLEGPQLEDALQSLIGTEEEEDLSEDAIRQDITHLEEEITNCQHRKELLIQQRNKLGQHQVAVSQRLSRLDGVEDVTKTQYKQCLEQSQAANIKVNGALSELVTSVGELNALYTELTTDTRQQFVEPKAPVFLSQISLDHYFKAEEKFTIELTSFTKKQFFEGIADMAGADEGSRYEILEVSNPDLLLVTGEKESTVYEACKEIARLQMHYPKSVSARVNALVEEKTTNTSCDHMEQRLRSLKQKPYPMDKIDLGNRLKDSQNKLSILRRDLLTLAEEDIPRLISESATLQVTWVLRGNYDLKITRQDYFMGNQEQVIEQLLRQKARYEFLTMAYELEVKGHRDTYRLLTAISILLQDLAKAHSDRMEMLKDPLLSTNRNQRSTLDSRDKYFTKLHQLLDRSGLNEKQQLFITYNELTDNSNKLNNHLTALRATYSTVNNNQDGRLRTLEKCVKGCEDMLYSGSSTLGGRPTLSPQPIVDTLTQLEGMLKQLERSVLDILNDVKNKKKCLENDRLLVTERELFVYFFNRPDRLRQIINDLSERVNAQEVT